MSWSHIGCLPAPRRAYCVCAVPVSMQPGSGRVSAFPAELCVCMYVSQGSGLQLLD